MRSRLLIPRSFGRGRGSVSRIAGTYLAAHTGRMVIRIHRLPAGFIFPAQPVLRVKPPAGTDWVHEIKHDGYRMIVHRDGPTVRLYSRNAYDWTARLAGIAAAAEGIKAKSFTIDGEAVLTGGTGWAGKTKPAGRPLMLIAMRQVSAASYVGSMWSVGPRPLPGREAKAGAA
jgi:hypothetical protein